MHSRSKNRGIITLQMIGAFGLLVFVIISYYLVTPVVFLTRNNILNTFGNIPIVNQIATNVGTNVNVAFAIIMIVIIAFIIISGFRREPDSGFVR